MKTVEPRSHAWLIVLEDGAKWPAWVDEHRVDEDTAVIVQQPGQRQHSLIQRVRELSVELATSGRSVTRAVLAVGSAAPVGQWARRSELSRAMLQTVSRGTGALVIVADDPIPRERHELLAFCGSLARMPVAAGIAVLLELEAQEAPERRSA
ncbi:MAG: hypothetical protein IPI67_23900 [Myxococcales bacterium]|nr:hypothetical protein [Myxococcales bacterium]